MLSKRAFALSKAKKRVSFFLSVLLARLRSSQGGRLAAGGVRGRARRLPPLFPRRGVRSRMAGSCSRPAAPPRPLPGSADAPEDGDGGRRGAGRIPIGLRKSGGSRGCREAATAIGKNPVGSAGFPPASDFPGMFDSPGFQRFRESWGCPCCAPGGGRGAEPRVRPGWGRRGHRKGRIALAHPLCGEHGKHLSCFGKSSFVNCFCARSWEYPEMGDWYYADVSNYIECKTMIRTPVTILARQGSGELGTCCSILISGLPRLMPEDLLAAVLKLPVQLLKSGLYDAVLFSLLPSSCISLSSWKGKRMGLEKERILF